MHIVPMTLTVTSARATRAKLEEIRRAIRCTNCHRESLDLLNEFYAMRELYEAHPAWQRAIARFI